MLARSCDATFAFPSFLPRFDSDDFLFSFPFRPSHPLPLFTLYFDDPYSISDLDPFSLSLSLSLFLFSSPSLLLLHDASLSALSSPFVSFITTLSSLV